MINAKMVKEDYTYLFLPLNKFHLPQRNRQFLVLRVIPLKEVIDMSETPTCLSIIRDNMTSRARSETNISVVREGTELDYNLRLLPTSKLRQYFMQTNLSVLVFHTCIYSPRTSCKRSGLKTSGISRDTFMFHFLFSEVPWI